MADFAASNHGDLHVQIRNCISNLVPRGFFTFRYKDNGVKNFSPLFSAVVLTSKNQELLETKFRYNTSLKRLRSFFWQKYKYYLKEFFVNSLTFLVTRIKLIHA